MAHHFCQLTLIEYKLSSAVCNGSNAWAKHGCGHTRYLSYSQLPAGIVLSIGAAIVAYISCEAAQRLKLADSAKLFALTFLLVTFGAQDGVSKLLPALRCCANQLFQSYRC